MKKEIGLLKDSQNNLVEKSKLDSSHIKEIKEELRNEINDFKLIKSRMEKKLVESFEREIKDELMPRFERLSGVVKNFGKMDSKAESVTARFDAINDEISKFIDISKRIKKEDFELVRFANQLKTMDTEKLELMRKIDSLERLVSKMRRSARQTFK